ncbi:MAG: cysteine desulfurase family protein [Myxococcota bacterium]
MTVSADVKARGTARLRERARSHLLLDANADMPVRSEALEAYLAAAALVAFPHEAAARAQKARLTIADLLGCAPSELVFTSGGTEADAVALQIVQGGGTRTLAVSAIEHSAVTKTAALLSKRAGRELVKVPVERSGIVDVAAVRALPAGVGLSLVAASNEMGAIQPVFEIAQIVRGSATLVHTDAAQLPGRAVCDVAKLGADVVTFSSHKVGAPGGLGVVVVRNGLPISRPSSSSSEHVASLVALAAALSSLPSASERSAIAACRDAIEQGLRTGLRDVWVVAGDVPRLANTTCIGFSGCEGDAVMMALDVRGIAVSTGSACSSGSIEASPVLLGMGLTAREAKSTIRISLPRVLDAPDTQRVVDTIVEVVTAARAMSA